MNTIKIYTLSDSNTIRYIGQTNNPKKRIYKHIFEANNSGGKNKRCSWIKSLLNKGERPILEIVDEVPFKEWGFWEQYWISQMKQWGFNLVNDTLGGEGSYGRKHSTETKSKMSKAKKGKLPKNIKLLQKSRIKGITQYDLNGDIIKEWESVNEAKETLGINNIELVVNKTRNSAGGFIWRFSNDKLTEKEINEIKEKHLKQEPKIILQIDKNGNMIKEWDSVNSIKKRYKHINAILRGDRKTAGGYYWEYKEGI